MKLAEAIAANKSLSSGNALWKPYNRARVRVTFGEPLHFCMEAPDEIVTMAKRVVRGLARNNGDE